jgi:hypothetical protein
LNIEKVTDVLAWSSNTEPKAIAFALKLCTNSNITFNVACSWIAMEFDCSIETSKRWLLKATCGHPRCTMFIDNVGFLRPVVSQPAPTRASPGKRKKASND